MTITTTTLWLLLLISILITISVIAWTVWRVKKSQIDEQQVDILSDMLMSVQDALILLNVFGTIEYINPAAEKLIKYKLRSAKGKKIYDLVSFLHPETRKKIKALTEFPLDFNRELKVACLLSPITQSGIFVNVRLIPINEGEKFIIVLDDLTETQALQSRLTYLETHDELTRFLNRDSFNVELNKALNEAKFHEKTHIYGHISLDQFRLINDSVGHHASETLIKNIAEIIKKSLASVKEYDVVRLGGDEFGILIRNCIPTEGMRWIDHVLESIANYQFSWNGVNYESTASAGLVLISKLSINATRILSAADAARKVAKEKGGNRIQIFRKDDALIQKQRAHARWAGRLKNAFEKNQFRLFAQPIHPLEQEKFKQPYQHYEVLIRLYDEKGQQISPDEFIPAAEHYSMMPELDKWVVKGVITYLKQITQKVPLPVFSVNLSGQSLDEAGFLKFVLNEIRTAGIHPEMLCFEITETVAIINLDLAMKFIQTLKKLGCSFSLDDFGTGMSSFEYLKTLTVDYLKIDGSFVKDIVTDDVQKAMVQSINQVGHMMGIQIIAEYVENNEIIKELREIGIDYGQGYGISRPIPLSEAVKAHY